MSVQREFIPLARPDVGLQEMREITAAARSGWLSTGPRVARFEEELRDAIGAAAVLPVSSCTAALHLSLLCAGVGPGDEVIASAMTFVSAINVIKQCGATPVLCDVDPATLNPSPESVAQLIGPKTKAIQVVHFAGQPCELEELRAIARSAGVPLIEDAAHAIGAEFQGRPIGSDADFACFSFYATKNLTTGEGGCLAFSDAKLLPEMKSLSLHGMTRGAWKRYGKSGSWHYDVETPGYKYNMTDMQAAFGLVQLERLPAMNERRRALVRAYDAAFADNPVVSPLEQRPGRTSAHHLYVLRVAANQSALDRDALIDALRAENIGTSVHFTPVYRFGAYRASFDPAEYPGCEEVADEIVSIPLWAGLREEELARVAESINRLTGRAPAMTAPSSPARPSRVELATLLEASPQDLNLTRLGLPENSASLEALDAAESLVHVRESGRLMGAAALGEKPWDSQVCGKKVGAIDVFAAACESARGTLLQRALRSAEERGFEYLYWRAPLRDGAEFEEPCAVGFEAIDVLLTFAKRVDNSAGSGSRVASMRTARPDEIDRLAEIAAGAFTVSRFHADPLFRPDAAEIHAQWVRNSHATALADAVLVIAQHRQPTAFLTLKIDEYGSHSRGTIGLLAVAPECRGRGEGRRLLEELGHWAAERGLAAVVVGTQTWNTPAVNLYTSAGFDVVQCSRTLKIELR